jgi:ubiquinone/menaquinone biosynthesis C-methylase UbiE
MHSRPPVGTYDDLSYFVEWGHHGWTKLLSIALRSFLGTDLHGQRILEIGPRHGRMSCLFALLGAEVWAVDRNSQYLAAAMAEARKWQVQDRIHFMYLDEGDLSRFKDGFFDIAFTKSVLVVIPDLQMLLEQVSSKIKNGGKVVFLENADGRFLFRLARLAKYRSSERSRNTRYFTNQEILLLSALFDLEIVKKTLIPPVFLVCGHKRVHGLAKTHAKKEPS